MIEAPTFDQISLEILQRAQQVGNKDGSQGLDALASLHQYHLAYAAAMQFVPQGASVLDWGGGSGHFSYFLHRNGYRPTIYSFFEPQYVLDEIKRGQITFTLADSNQPTTLPYSDNSFDAVFSIGVLEHVRETGGNERASVAEIRRILKPNGVFICFHFPNRGSWIEWLASKIGSYHHQFTYGTDDVNAIFNGQLLVVVKHRYALFPRNSLRRLPRAVVNHPLFCKAFNFADKWAAKCMPWINQNWLVISRKSHIGN